MGPIGLRFSRHRGLRGRRPGRCRPANCALCYPAVYRNPHASSMRCWTSGPTTADIAADALRGTSAILPLLVDEPVRERVLELYQDDPQIVAWWATPVEIASAVSRRERGRLIVAEDAAAALSAVRRLAAAWHEVVPSDMVRRTAERLLRVHALRAADSPQLAAIMIAANHDPTTLEVVCFDGRLTAAARREGFTVIDC